MDFFLGEIKMVAFNFAPRHWASCDGQLESITQNPALYAVIGDSFGGDGITTMGFPNLKGRVPLGAGYGNYLGLYSGLEEVKLESANIPNHNHSLMVSNDSSSNKTENPEDAILSSNSDNKNAFQALNSTDSVNLREDTLALTGGSKAHTNIQPSLALNFIICTEGLFPSRN